MSLTLLTVLFIGRSGCGKGTQAEELMRIIGEKDPAAKIFYFQTGDRLRTLTRGASYTARLAKKIMDEGGRQPSFLATYMWGREFAEDLTGKEHIIIDGSPRSLLEAEMLDTAFSFYARDVHVVYLNISRDEAVRRLLLRKRKDDISQETIEERLSWFEKDVFPAIEFYKNHKMHKFLEVNGEQPVDAVRDDIFKRLPIPIA